MSKLSVLFLVFAAVPTLASEQVVVNNYEKYFDLFFPQDKLCGALVQVFAGYSDACNIKPEDAAKFQSQCSDKAYDLLKKEMILVLQKTFDLNQVAEIITFLETPTGSLWLQQNEALTACMMPIMQTFPKIAQEVSAWFVTVPVASEQNSSVIEFEELVLDSSDAQAEAKYNELTSKDLVIVKFSAAWCPPCRVYAPIFKSVASELTKVGDLNVKYVSVNADLCPSAVKLAGVQGLPTTVVYKNGKVAKKQVGLLDKNVLVQLINDAAQA